jgi:phosphoglycerol transferase MdoB-like AlkP superfamily enzyme
MKIESEQKSSKSLLDVFFMRVLPASFCLVFVYFGAAGIFLKETWILSRFSGTEQYTGNSAVFLGLAYLCFASIAFFGFFLDEIFKRKGKKKELKRIMFGFGLVSILSLFTAITIQMKS